MADEMEVLVQEEEISNYLPRKFREMNVNSESASGAARPALLFSLIARPEQHEPLLKLKFYRCAIRDRKLPHFLGQVEERSVVFPEAMRHHLESMIHQCCMKEIGDKVVFWIGYPGMSFSCIMSAHNKKIDWAFRELDTSTIRSELQPETEIQDGASRGPYNIQESMTGIVGNRLLLLLYGGFRGHSWWTMRMFSLDGNTETWSVLPDCLDDINKYCMPVSWKGNLYIYNLNALSQRNVDSLVLLHFDFERNMWVDRFSSPVNNTFAKRLMELPRSCLASVVTSFLISSRSGTLYAIFGHAQLYDDYNSVPVYAMDHLGSGWIEVSLGKGVHTRQYRDPFPLPTRTCQICGSHYDGFQLIRFWEIGEHDILLLIVQFHPICMDKLRYSWWVFNKDEGVKSYSSEELPVPMPIGSPKSDLNLLVAKIE